MFGNNEKFDLNLIMLYGGYELWWLNFKFLLNIKYIFVDYIVFYVCMIKFIEIIYWWFVLNIFWLLDGMIKGIKIGLRMIKIMYLVCVLIVKFSLLNYDIM